MKITAKFIIKRETKGAVVYEEVNNDGVAVGTEGR
jgi:hypothetical protein